MEYARFGNIRFGFKKKKEKQEFMNDLKGKKKKRIPKSKRKAMERHKHHSHELNIYSTYSIRKHLKVDKYLSNRYLKIGYRYDKKGAGYVWYRLKGDEVNKVNLKQRDRFYEDERLPKQYRTAWHDYIRTGYDRGHMANDAAFDMNKKMLKHVYVMSNIVPQRHPLNAKAWASVEKRARDMAVKHRYVYVINVLFYENNDKLPKSNIGIPTTFYKIIINKHNKYYEIFKLHQSDSIEDYRKYSITLEEFENDLKRYRG